VLDNLADTAVLTGIYGRTRECAVITSSPSDIQAARAAGAHSIGYAKTPDDDAHLIDVGASAFVYSMADLALRIRAAPLTKE
jgi:beta-phosphoglucomutase-like phosphatase (HAD superfamily)